MQDLQRHRKGKGGKLLCGAEEGVRNLARNIKVMPVTCMTMFIRRVFPSFFPVKPAIKAK